MSMTSVRMHTDKLQVTFVPEKSGMFFWLPIKASLTFTKYVVCLINRLIEIVSTLVNLLKKGLSNGRKVIIS